MKLRVLVCALAVAGTACGDGGSGPTAEAGTLTVRVSSPEPAEGAALVDVHGPIRDVVGVQGDVFVEEMDGGTRVLVVLETPGEIRFQLTVGDVSVLPSFTLLEVAGPDNTLRTSLSAYAISVSH